MAMIRLNICISDSQDERLRRLCKDTGLGVAEVMRRAFDFFADFKERETNRETLKEEE